MHALVTLSSPLGSSSLSYRSDHSLRLFSVSAPAPRNFQFCGLRSDVLRLKTSNLSCSTGVIASPRQNLTTKISASLSENGTPKKGFDYDLVIIGAGVGGHGAALHAVEKVG